MERKRIAIFAEKLYGGGVEKILQIICRNFDYEKYDLTIYASRREEYPQGTYPDHLQIKYIFDSGNSLISRIKNKLKLFVYYHFSPSVYYQLFIRQAYDVGIAFIEGYATRFLSGAPRGMKKIAWVHIELKTFHWTQVAYRSQKEECMCYHTIDKVACVSKVVKEQADILWGISDKTLVLHNPIESERIIRLAEEDMPSIYRHKKHAFRIVSLGTLNKRKSYDRLIQAVARLDKDGYDVELLILGEGEEKEALKQQILDTNLSERVFLVGFVHNPYPFIVSSDIYVCSSYAEGYNTAVTEALVLGRAVVSTEVSGIREQLGENEEYGIITPNTEDGLYLGLKRMMNAGCIEEYQERAEKRGREFTLDKQMQKIYTLIEE